MYITELIEHEDGSATVTFQLSKEETSMLLEASILRAIKNYVESSKNE